MIYILFFLTTSTTWAFLRQFTYHHGAALLAKKEWQPPVPEIPGDEGNGVSFRNRVTKKGWYKLGQRSELQLGVRTRCGAYGRSGSKRNGAKGDYIIGMGNTSCIGKDFDFVLSTYNSQPSTFNYTFFRGTKEQLLGGPVPAPEETTVTVTVKQAGKPDIMLDCPGGTNLREVAGGNGINVYRSLTRWTNCNGQQRWRNMHCGCWQGRFEGVAEKHLTSRLYWLKTARDTDSHA